MLYIIRNLAKADMMTIRDAVCAATNFDATDAETTYDLATGDCPIAVVWDGIKGNPDVAFINVTEKPDVTTLGTISWLTPTEETLTVLGKIASRVLGEFFGEATACCGIGGLATGIVHGPYHYAVYPMVFQRASQLKEAAKILLERRDAQRN